MKRNEYIDCVKGIGILCVYLGHLVVYGSPLFRVIFNFHMPLFFFVSGCFFKPEEDRKRYFGRMAVNIGIPILFFTVIGALSLIFCQGTEIPHKEVWPYWLVYLVSTWYIGPLFVPSVWFLFCLAGTQAFAWFIWPWCRKNRAHIVSVLLVCVLVAYGIAQLDLHFKYLFPLHTASIPMAFVFYCLGYLCREWIKRMTQVGFRPIAVFVTVVCLATEVFFAVELCGESPNLAVPDFPCLWTFAVASITGIASIFLMSGFLCLKPFVFWGRYSLYLFMTEKYAQRVAYAVLHAIDSELPVQFDVNSLSRWHMGFVLISSLVCASFFVWLLSPTLEFVQHYVRVRLEDRRNKQVAKVQSGCAAETAPPHGCVSGVVLDQVNSDSRE